MDWVRYVLVPIVAGSLAVSDFLRAKRPDAAARGLPRYAAMAGLTLLACSALNWFDLVRMTGEMNGIGLLLFALTMVAQLGVGLLLSFDAIGPYLPGPAAKKALLREKLLSAELPLGLLAIGTSVAMVLVRQQILGIFG